MAARMASTPIKARRLMGPLQLVDLQSRGAAPEMNARPSKHRTRESSTARGRGAALVQRVLWLEAPCAGLALAAPGEPTAPSGERAASAAAAGGEAPWPSKVPRLPGPTIAAGAPPAGV